MTPLRSCMFAGVVTHKRLEPRRHAFSYRVFALCLDLDEIDDIGCRLRLFSHNRFNAVSFWDTDVGDGGADPPGANVRRLLHGAGLNAFATRIELLCYPRLFGYVFNPLSVYFCRDAAGTVGAIIYEVSNTFGERKSYVIETGDGSTATLSHRCAKELYVSPFTAADGRYSFHVVPPSNRVVVGVAIREAGRPVLKTHFRGERVGLSDAALLGVLARHPLMTLKVMGAIHYEALRLWVKGVPLVERHKSPGYSVSIIRARASVA